MNIDVLVIIAVFAALLVVLVDVNVWYWRLPKHERDIDEDMR